MKTKVIKLLGNLIRNQNTDKIEQLIKERFPNGSGFDSGTKLISATEDKVVLQADFHHMSEHGYYTGWTEHQVIIKPHFEFGYILKVTGKNKRDIKPYIEEYFYNILNEEIETERRWFDRD